MSHLSLFLFGPPRIEGDGTPIKLDNRKATALLTYLAVTDKSHRRDSLANLLWADYDQSRARNLLRQNLHALKVALPNDSLDVDRESVSLNPDADIETDVDQFHLYLADCRTHGHPTTETCPDCLEPLTQAVKLYQDDFLAGFSIQDSVNFDDWQLAQAQSLGRDLAGALERLVLGHSAEGELEIGISYARRWLRLDPTHEPAHRHLMQLYTWTGQRSQALRQYEQCLKTLERELATFPQEETTQLYEAIKENALSMKEASSSNRGVQAAQSPPLESPNVSSRNPSPHPSNSSPSLGPAHDLITGGGGTTMGSLPTGTVTFLFTDIETSTRLLVQLGDRYADLLVEHHRLLRAAFQARGGREVDTQGDAFFVSFARAKDAVLAATAAQKAINRHTWSDGVSVRVRMGLHTGEPISSEIGYVGMDVHRSARICSAGHGGQILLSQATGALVQNDLPQGASLRDLGKHRLKDLQHPEQVFQLLHPDLPTDFPPLKSLDALPNNLPIQLTSFIGREKEIEEVKNSFTKTRLLTLTGSGGCGKTRLGLQALADLVDEFPDGVWVVELAPLSDPGLVAQEVASVLGIREESGSLLMGEGSPEALSGISDDFPLTSKLTEYLGPKQLLLMLDNCEHLIETCATLSDTLLRSCPSLRILVASREALGIAGESTYRVPSLSLPDPKNLPEGTDLVSTLATYEAIGLFIDRAVAVQPTFALTNDNATSVAQVCHRLDGIPLAIELAAARVRVLPVEQIIKRIDDRFRLLTGGSRTALPRQQTLRATMDWSYNLLTDAERVLLNRLSVFAGGWMLPAAEAVCAGDSIEEDEVLDLLTNLADKSLVVVEEKSGEGRYRLLETVRQFSRDKLVESGEGERVRNQHLDFFLRLAEQAEPEFRGPDQIVWLGRLEEEHSNLMAALDWSKIGEGSLESGLRLAGALWYFFRVRVYRYNSEYLEMLEELLSVSSGISDSVRAKAFGAAGLLAHQRRSFGRATAFYEESIALSHQTGDKWVEAFALVCLVVLLSEQRDYDRSEALHNESLALFRELEDKWGIAFSSRNFGSWLHNQGDYDRAAALV